VTSDDLGPWDCLSDWPPPAGEVAFMARRFCWTPQEIGTLPADLLRTFLDLAAEEGS
jgi:hypothetical protein